jgi:hypothetical protein
LAEYAPHHFFWVVPSVFSLCDPELNVEELLILGEEMPDADKETADNDVEIRIDGMRLCVSPLAALYFLSIWSAKFNVPIKDLVPIWEPVLSEGEFNRLVEFWCGPDPDDEPLG